MSTTRQRVSRSRRDKPRKGDLRELAILDTAERLLGEIGADAMTVEGVARGAGLTRGALYFYFGSKNEVLAALVARTLEALEDTARIAADDVDTPPADVIRRSIKATESQWRDHGHVMRAAVELSPTVPDIELLWGETLELSVASYTNILLRAGVPGGKGPTGAAALARGLVLAVERSFYFATAPPVRPATLRRVTATCTALWLSVIGTAGSGTPSPGG